MAHIAPRAPTSTAPTEQPDHRGPELRAAPQQLRIARHEEEEVHVRVPWEIGRRSEYHGERIRNTPLASRGWRASSYFGT